MAKKLTEKRPNKLPSYYTKVNIELNAAALQTLFTTMSSHSLLQTGMTPWNAMLISVQKGK